MKHKIFSILMSAAVALGFSSCNEKWEPGGNNSGDTGSLDTESISLDVTNAEDIITSRASIDVSNYIITVTNADGLVVNQWKFAEMPGLPVFTVGEYTLDIKSHEPKLAAWDEPYFVGSTKFSIKKNEITRIGAVKCRLQNVKVSIKFADDLVAASAGDINCEVRVNDEGVLNYTPAIKSSGYFKYIEGNYTMVVTFTGTINGYKENIIRTYTDLKPGQHRIINFTLKTIVVNPPSETGQIDPTQGITVDWTVVDSDLTGNIETGEDIITDPTRPGGEEWPDEPTPPGPVDPVDPDDPKTDNCINFKSETLDLTDNNVNKATDFGPGIKDAVVTILAEHGLSNLVVTINSVGLNADELAAIGLPQSFDLAHPANDEVTDALTQLGFPTKSGVIGQNKVEFDITTFVPLLPNFEAPHKFIIKATDTQGHSKSLELNFENE